MGESKRKRSREARPEEILTGKHGPVQSGVEMTEILKTLKVLMPGFDFALFVIEKPEHAPPCVLPRFNYGATVDRADMVNMLNAFVQKNKELLHIDEAMKKEAEGSA